MNKEDFPFFDNKINKREVIYLDNAATTQKPKCVLESIYETYTQYNANVHRGSYYLSEKATELHEKARDTIAKYINARDNKEIVFTGGTTDSINKLVLMLSDILKNEDEVIITAMEHHANIVPWQLLQKNIKIKIKVVPLTENLTLDLTQLEKQITERTKIISFTYISNVLGIKNNVNAIIKKAHQHNIITIVDAAQAIQHTAIDVQKIDCDFLIFSGHKMYGPTGIGILYGKEKWLQNFNPVQGGGEMIKHVSFEKTTFNELPYKFEAGTPNFNSSVALSVACNYINSIGLDNIEKYEEQLTDYTEEELKKIPNIIIYGHKVKKNSVISFNIRNNKGYLIHPFDIGYLLNEQGIALRTGHHCAEPLIDLLKIPGTIRLSIAFYNDESDIEKFITALKKTIAVLS